MKVYEKINQYLMENGIKQKFVAEKSHIPENVLSTILSGKRKMGADELIDIVIAIDLDPNSFVNSLKNKKYSEELDEVTINKD